MSKSIAKSSVSGNNPNFSQLVRNGFKVVSIIPPNAELSSNTGIGLEARGKAPGSLHSDGTWSGTSNWQNISATEDDARQWSDDGANIGIITKHTPAIDIDVTNADAAKDIEALALKELGNAPRRTGEAPKRLLPYRTSIPFRKSAIEFVHDKTGEKAVIEVLCDGQQFVAHGIHPSTKKPFTWKRGDPAKGLSHDDLTDITKSQVDDFLLKAVSVMTEHQYSVKSKSTAGSSHRRKPVGDPSLLGNPTEIEYALKIMGNDYSYGEWIKKCAAIKGAVGGKEEHYPIFENWCLIWQETRDGEVRTNTPEYIRKVWDSFTDTEVGFDHLMYEAMRIAKTNNDDVQATYFENALKEKKIALMNWVAVKIKEQHSGPSYFDPNLKANEHDPDIAQNDNESYELPSLPEHPNGAVGDLARYVETLQPYHSKSAAAAFALALMSRIASHRYFAQSCIQPTGTALNLYLLLAAPTGMGKNSFLTVAQNISEELKIKLVPSSFASEQAINRCLSEAARKPVLMFNDEYGIKLKMLKKSGETLVGIQRYIMELYGNAMTIAGGKMYSKEKDDLKEVHRPYLVTMAVSTKTELEGGLDETSARNGSVNRFIYVEHDGGIGQRRHGFVVPEVPKSIHAVVKQLWRDPDKLDDAIKHMREDYSKGEDDSKALPFNKTADVVIRNYSDEVDAIRTRYPDSIRDVLMARLVENAIKIAGLVALGRGAKEVNKTDANYGVQFMQYSISRVLPFVHSAIEKGAKNDYAVAPKLQERLQNMLSDPEAFVAGCAQAQNKGWGRYLKHGFVTRSMMTHAVKNISRNTTERDDAISFMLEAGTLIECGKIAVQGNKVSLYALEQRGQKNVDACAAEFK